MYIDFLDVTERMISIDLEGFINLWDYDSTGYKGYKDSENY